MYRRRLLMISNTCHSSLHFCPPQGLALMSRINNMLLPCPSSPPLRAPFEVLLRRLLLMPSRPAVVVLNGFRMTNRYSPETGPRGMETVWR